MVALDGGGGIKILNTPRTSKLPQRIFCGQGKKGRRGGGVIKEGLYSAHLLRRGDFLSSEICHVYRRRISGMEGVAVRGTIGKTILTLRGRSISTNSRSEKGGGRDLAEGKSDFKKMMNLAEETLHGSKGVDIGLLLEKGKDQISKPRARDEKHQG